MPPYDEWARAEQARAKRRERLVFVLAAGSAVVLAVWLLLG